MYLSGIRQRMYTRLRTDCMSELGYPEENMVSAKTPNDTLRFRKAVDNAFTNTNPLNVHVQQQNVEVLLY